MKKCLAFKKSMFISVVCLIMSAVLLSSCSYIDQLEAELDKLLSDSINTIPQTEPPTVPEVTYSLSDSKEITDYGFQNISNGVSKELYTLIGENVLNVYEYEFSIDGELTSTQIFEALEAYRNDNPQIFWVKSSYEYYNYNGKTFITIDYTMENDELINAKREFDHTVEQIIAKAPESATEYEYELFANNYLIDNCGYDKQAAQSEGLEGNENDAYGALVQKKAVCEGYARAFQLLCNELGVECVNVTGMADGEGHQWNCVKLDDEWYSVDVTWNDCEKGKEMFINDYLNLTDEQMNKTHTSSKLYANVSVEEFENMDTQCNVFVPKCMGKRYNYYKYNCVTLTDLDNADSVIAELAKAAAKGEKYFSFVIGEELDFEYACDQIIDYGYFANWIDKANEINGYSAQLNYECSVYTKDELRVLTNVLEYY